MLSSITLEVCCCTTLESQMFESVKKMNYHRYNLNIVSWVPEMKHFMAHGRVDISAVLAVASVSIICPHTWPKTIPPLVNCILNNYAVLVSCKCSAISASFRQPWAAATDKFATAWAWHFISCSKLGWAQRLFDSYRSDRIKEVLPTQ